MLVPGLAAGQQTEQIASGRALVEDNCIRCHGIGEADESSHPDAPEFRALSKRYPIEALGEAFVEGIVTGHPDMPEFVATPVQTAAIIAYIESIQE
ncbi:c-type cytochrome [Aurantimonas marianensis]|uniref:Cytochrome c n=1 Tax=Aurantimonas marianensis TaxID=2920428 RepID=A0A9X2H8Y2_9HYPH|nr:cytochrome c [Aurantimonas marianensis]MCP3056506.1 cytochrome c [Aurantimonas marianensis]